jgi:hypothetical protein
MGIEQFEQSVFNEWKFNLQEELEFFIAQLNRPGETFHSVLPAIKSLYFDIQKDITAISDNIQFINRIATLEKLAEDLSNNRKWKES